MYDESRSQTGSGTRRRRDVGDNRATSNALPLPGTQAYEELLRFPTRSALPFRRTIRRKELRLFVPLAAC